MSHKALHGLEVYFLVPPKINSMTQLRIFTAYMNTSRAYQLLQEYLKPGNVFYNSNSDAIHVVCNLLKSSEMSKQLSVILKRPFLCYVLK